MAGKLYSEYELDFIASHYKRIPTREIADKVGRTVSSIHNLCRRIGISDNRNREAYLPNIEIAQTDLAWAAGILEGEGYFCCLERKDRKGIWRRSISVNQLEIRVEMLSRLKTLFGGTIRVFRKESCKDKKILVWKIGRKKDIASAINKILPYIVTLDKRQQALFVLSKCEEEQHA
jgi:hypothetical protein